MSSLIDFDRKTNESDSIKPTTDLNEVIDLSSKFPIKFPINTTKCCTLKETVSDETLERNILSTYPLIHQNVLNLYLEFLKHKKLYGSKIEKNLYKDMNVIDLVDRLLKKRAMVFVGVFDYYMLRDGTEGHGNWESIGTQNEKPPLVLNDYLSYDEIKLSAFLSVSSYTYFINDGRRQNCGIFEKDREKIEDEGIIIGLIGTRLVKRNVMEYQDIIIEPEQNTEKNGFGSNTDPNMIKLYSEYYDKINMEYKKFLKSEQIKDSQNYPKIRDSTYFDNSTYSKRLALSLDTLFLEANTRAKNAQKLAYIHLVGIGLGVWLKSTHQLDLFARVTAERIKYLGERLHNVSDVDLSYIHCTSCGDYKDGDKIPIPGHPKEGIRVYITSKSLPHVRLTGEHEGKLRVVSYAWDANAFPGNEYWTGSLQTSSDPAAACSTQVTELHNAYINRMVCGRNLHVATKDGGVVHINQCLR